MKVVDASKSKAKTRRTQAERRAETRAAFLDAAWDVFLRRGYAAASLDEIAAEAGYTRGAFHYNFASKAELFTELLQDRVYAVYRKMAERRLKGEASRDVRSGAGELAALQSGPAARKLFRLWLELLAESGRDRKLRALAAGFWSGNRELLAELIRQEYEDRGEAPPLEPRKLATAVIAMDVGLSIQHQVDPESVPLDLYPEIFEALFG